MNRYSIGLTSCVEPSQICLGPRASAIRFYEKAGLIPKPLRSGGQRRYDRTILDRLAVLEFAIECGFTLAEARQLFSGFRDPSLSRRSCSTQHTLAPGVTGRKLRASYSGLGFGAMKEILAGFAPG
jgi:DNA-binding transcriptional MerR regulator